MALHAFRSSWEPAPRAAPPGTMLLAVGDVHGHLAHLDALLGLLRPEVERARAEGLGCELVLVGDYVDRGPDSLGALRRLIGLEERLGVPVHALRGNHDLYLIEFILAQDPEPEAFEAWLGNGGDTTLAELSIGPDDVLSLPLAELAARARAAAGPETLAALGRLELERTVGDYVFVHAGVAPVRPLAEQGEREFLWMREPFLAGRGWRQPFAVVHGHTIRGPEVRPHRVAVDSGAYRTGVLTAVQIEGERLRFLGVASDPELRAFRRLPGLEQPRRFSRPEPLPAGSQHC